MDISTDPKSYLKNVVRPTLARMEDSLIFGLAERLRYKFNPVIYVPGGIPINLMPSNQSDYFPISSPPDIPISFLDFILEGTEKVHALAGRFSHPEEHPFSDNLPLSIFKREFTPSPLKGKAINENSLIKTSYFDILRKFCDSGDDGHYGSSAVADVKVLQDLSKRVHFGLYVAESKFLADPSLFVDAIRLRDTSALENGIVDQKQEDAVLNRVKEKGERYGLLNADKLVTFYKELVIPLTKKVEIDYLLNRGE